MPSLARAPECIAALVLAAYLAPSHAYACECSPPRLDLTSPDPLPTNPVLWVDVAREISDELVDPPRFILRSDVEQLELDVTSLDVAGSSTVAVLEPQQDLQPTTHYDLLACPTEDCAVSLRELVTGTGPDDTPPPLPIERNRHSDKQGAGLGLYGCGVTHFIELEVEFEGLLVVELGDAELDVDARSGFVDEITTQQKFELGDNCVGNWPLDADRQSLRYGAYDLAGNFSGWQEADDLELPGCGCQTSDPRAIGWATLVVLALRRRRANADA